MSVTSKDLPEHWPDPRGCERIAALWREFPPEKFFAANPTKPEITPSAARKQAAKPISPEPNPLGLRTPREAAARLRCSTKTLDRYVTAGLLRYVELPGRGKRPLRRFTDADLTELITNQTRKDIPLPCPSTKATARHSGSRNSNVVAVGFTARPKPGRGGKPKP
jgi:hypothetical protein